MIKSYKDFYTYKSYLKHKYYIIIYILTLGVVFCMCATIIEQTRFITFKFLIYIIYALYAGVSLKLYFANHQLLKGLKADFKHGEILQVLSLHDIKTGTLPTSVLEMLNYRAIHNSFSLLYQYGFSDEIDKSKFNITCSHEELVERSYIATYLIDYVMHTIIFSYCMDYLCLHFNHMDEFTHTTDKWDNINSDLEHFENIMIKNYTNAVDENSVKHELQNHVKNYINKLGQDIIQNNIHFIFDDSVSFIISLSMSIYKGGNE